MEWRHYLKKPSKKCSLKQKLIYEASVTMLDAMQTNYLPYLVQKNVHTCNTLKPIRKTQPPKTFYTIDSEGRHGFNRWGIA